jgi:hypothetical protein
MAVMKHGTKLAVTTGIVLLLAAVAYSQAVPSAGSTVTIKNVNSGLCVDTGGSSGFSSLFQASCSAASSQNFTLQTAPAAGYYYLVNSASNLCWDVAGGSTSVGASIQQYTCVASSAEYYQLSQVSAGVYKILSGSIANGCIDVVGASTASGATIEQNTCDGSTNQTFQISVVGTPVAGTLVDVTTFGATGNGTTNDTTAINNAIAALTSGATLRFPCGTYLTTSQLTINISNVTVDGSSCAIIHNTGSGAIMVIGGSGNGNPNYGPAVALSTTANELATSFTTISSLGVSTGDYVYLQQGGKDSSNGSGDTGCDPSGCRGEVLKAASVSGNTITVTTALHDTYNPSVNAATARRILGPLTAITVKNITFDGNGSNVYGFEMAGVAESTVSGVTSRNVQGAAILNRGNFNVAWSNVTVTGAGSAQCGDAVWFENQGNLSVNGMSISSENSGTGSGCLANGAFGFGLIDSANSTITNLTVDAAGAYGRPFKTTASRWNTFNSLTVKNGVQAYNGISLEYYSSHNTFNNCVVTNNGAGTGTGTGNAGINSFGNFNQFNTFNNCTVTGNGNLQVLINNYDALHLGQDSNVTIKGGTYTGTNTVEPVISIIGSTANVTSTNINGPGAQGLYLGSTNACVNSNIFGGGAGMSAGILSTSSTNLGSANVMNGYSSNLTAGTCSTPPAPSACDLNGDGVVDILDVQIEKNQVLGIVPCTNGDLNGDGYCNVIDLQRIVNAAQGQGCRTGP